MKKRYSTEQIIRILKEVEASGLNVSDACRPHQISEQTYYRRGEAEAKRPAQAIGGRPELGQPDSQGSELKKMVSPMQKRFAVERVICMG